MSDLAPARKMLALLPELNEALQFQIEAEKITLDNFKRGHATELECKRKALEISKTQTLIAGIESLKPLLDCTIEAFVPSGADCHPNSPHASKFIFTRKP